MKAYAKSASVTRNSESTVRGWVSLEDETSMDALESARENCGRTTNFSPRKKSRLDKLMEDTEGEPTLRQTEVLQRVWEEDLTAAKIECACSTSLSL